MIKRKVRQTTRKTKDSHKRKKRSNKSPFFLRIWSYHFHLWRYTISTHGHLLLELSTFFKGNLLYVEDLQLYQKENATLVFSCQFCEMSRKNFVIECHCFFQYSNLLIFIIFQNTSWKVLLKDMKISKLKESS